MRLGCAVISVIFGVILLLVAILTGHMPPAQDQTPLVFSLFFFLIAILSYLVSLIPTPRSPDPPSIWHNDRMPGWPGQRMEMEVVLVHEGMAVVSSIISDLVMNGPIMKKYRFVARVFSPDGTYEPASIEYTELFFGGDSVGKQSEDSQKALDQLRQAIECNGWQPIGIGTYWYSYRYQKID